MDDHTTAHQPVLVVGGTGKTGRRVARLLEARGRDVRIGSRQATPPFDWNDSAAWPDALAGVGSAFVTYYPDLAFPGAVEAVEQFTAMAVAGGVQRLVLLSGRGEPEAQRAEEVVATAGVPWTVVRSSWFAQNFSEHFLLQPVIEGVIALPAKDVPEPFVDLDDVAEVAVAALTEDGHDAQVYEVTGPRLLTFVDAARELTEAIGREIRFVTVTPQEYAAAAVAQGMPEDEIGGMVALFTDVLAGHNAYVTDGVQRALGRAPRDFADYARDTAATGVWGGVTAG